MSNGGAIGFGGFLLGFGAGYLIFREINLAVNSLAWILMIIGAAILLSALIRYASPNLGIHRIVGGLASGLVFALFLTQGFNFFSGIFNTGNNFLPYSITDVKTYKGPSQSDVIYLRLGSINGQITLSTWDKSEYSIEATIVARGATQAEADANLANLNKELTKDETSVQQRLTLLYTSNLLNNPYQINVVVKLPASSTLNLDLTSSNGIINLTNVDGDAVVVHTTNAALQLNNVSADTLRASTSNGAITGTVDTSTCTLETSNARINLQILSTNSGSYTLDTSNGAVNLTVGAAASYKLDAETSNADVTFNLPNLKYSRDTRTSKVAQSVNYDTSDIKISVKIQTSNGDVTVNRNVAGY